MRLNTLKPAEGSKPGPKRLGRGVGSGLGKTSGKGHKGQHARAGGYHRVGFEGGQTALQRRLPKRGFRSKIAAGVAQIRLDVLNAQPVSEFDILSLIACNLVPAGTHKVKIIASGEITRAITVKGLLPTAGAKAAIEAAGGTIA